MDKTEAFKISFMNIQLSKKSIMFYFEIPTVAERKGMINVLYRQNGHCIMFNRQLLIITGDIRS